MESQDLSIGIDVSKHQLDYTSHDRCSQQGQVSNTPSGIAALSEALRALAPERIVIESTGGYERAAARALADAGLPVVVVNPRPVRHFAKALGILAKTDTLDAAVLAQYGATLKPKPRATRSDEEQAMADLMARRRQLFSMIVMEKNRLAAPVRALTRRIEAHIRWLEREANSTDALLDAWIAADPERNAQARILESVPGVGSVVAKNPDDRSPRTRPSRQAHALGAGRRCALQSRQRLGARKAPCAFRTRLDPRDPLHGGAHRQPFQPRAEGLLRAPTRRRQAEEARPHRRRPQAADHPQCDGPKSHDVGSTVMS